MIMVMPVIAKPVIDTPDAVGSLLDEGPALRGKRTSIIRGLMSAFDHPATDVASPKQSQLVMFIRAPPVILMARSAK
jgi:hypothetical protein